AGTSSFCWRALIALRIRVNKSATGSVKLILISSSTFRVSPPQAETSSETVLHNGFRLSALGVRPLNFVKGGWPNVKSRPPTALLPGRLCDTGNLPAQRQTAEAQAADSELAQICARTPAELAAVMPARRKFRPLDFFVARLLELLLDLLVLHSFCDSHAILRNCLLITVSTSGYP